MRRIYEKYNQGDPLSDRELDYGIYFFKRLESDLAELGPVFKLSGNEARRVLFALESFKKAREEHILSK